MTVKVVDDDFYQCPRCDGLMPIGLRKLVLPEEKNIGIHNNMINIYETKGYNQAIQDIKKLNEGE